MECLDVCKVKALSWACYTRGLHERSFLYPIKNNANKWPDLALPGISNDEITHIRKSDDKSQKSGHCSCPQTIMVRSIVKKEARASYYWQPSKTIEARRAEWAILTCPPRFGAYHNKMKKNQRMPRRAIVVGSSRVTHRATRGYG